MLKLMTNKGPNNVLNTCANGANFPSDFGADKIIIEMISVGEKLE